MTDLSPDSSEAIHCSFCGKAKTQIKSLIAGPGVFICDECIELCNDILGQGEREARTAAYPATPSAIDSLVAAADAAIPGQQATKRTLAAALTEALMNISDPRGNPGGRAILVLGPAGSGKREIIAAMTRALGLPQLKIDIPLLFPNSPFVGSYDGTAAWHGGEGAILVDHLDALLDPERGESARQLQHALATVLDGAELRIFDRSDHRVNTARAVFIGVCDLPAQQKTHHLEAPAGLLGMGFIPGLTARFGTVVAFDPPDQAAYEAMLVQTGGLFEQYRDRLEGGGRAVEFAADAADPIATWAVRRNEGILGLLALMSRLCRVVILDPRLGLDEAATLDARWVMGTLPAADEE